MLTGLLFAIDEAIEAPARLVATLPFVGVTLIEHQARQLVAAGAGQILVIGERETPELLGALRRIGRHGIGRHEVAVDSVRGAAEAAAALHPLARVVMLADGLVTGDGVVRLLAREGGDALLVIPAEGAPASFERIGGASAWAGAACLDAQRLFELARLPADYDPCSTLVRLAEAAGAAHLPLPEAAMRDGHGIERDAASLALRGGRIVAAAVPARRDWFDRFVAAPLTRAALPPLVARGVETVAVAVSAAVLGIGGGVALAFDWPSAALLLGIAATLAGGVGRAMATLRDEPGLRRGLGAGMFAVASAAVLLLGWRCSAARADGAALAIAVSLAVAMALVERARASPSIGWGGAAACLLVVAVATLVGWPVAGLAVATGYAAVTLALAIEALRREA